jgi:DNA (cytosine-5)-methyltransferase 1
VGEVKVLNLYAGIGGNRRLWEDCHVTAVELDNDIAAVYKDMFPNDTMIIGDAHQYLLDHFNEFDFIWSSPPCQTHSSFRQNIGVRFRGVSPAYPDMKLYQEIIFLQNNATCNWVVENVKPYYTPLIQPTFEMQRHLFWSNKNIHSRTFECEKLRSAQIPDLESLHGVDLSGYKLPNKRQVLRNCVHKEVGLHIFQEINKNIKQMDLFQ